MHIAFNLATKFGSDLREEAIEPEQFRLAKQHLLQEIQSGQKFDTHELRDRYSLLGFICRVLGDYHESLTYADRAFQLARQLNMVLLLAIDQIRLATSYHHAGDWSRAEELFLESMDICHNFQPLDEVVDFAYQHYAKLLLDKGQLELSREYFRRALEIRRKKGIAELTQASEFALEVIDRKLSLH